MRRISILLAVLVALAMGASAGLAQLETPVAPAATPAEPTRPDLVGVAPLPLAGERLAAFEAYVAAALERFGVPGASVAVVQGDRVVFLQGFGVREVGGSEPVSPDTLMMIGSVTKSMTSTMAATLVDAGWLSWDDPVVDLLPAFALAEPERTRRVTVADAFCACTGLPRRDVELIINFHALTPAGIITGARDLPLTAPFGEKFQYSNQMYAIGGYAAAAAAGAAPDDPYGGYVALMRDRLLNPLGMERSTFSLDDVLGSGDYAHPHGANLDGQVVPLSLLGDQGFVTPLAPAGALWSTARDMAAYVQMELNDGIAPTGARIVSPENLARTLAPRVAVPNDPEAPAMFNEAIQHYALGWGIGEWRGLRSVNHSGGTLGFGSHVAFLPEAELGIAILTNGGGAGNTLALAVQHRLYELAFDQPADFDALIASSFAGQAAELDAVRARLGRIDASAVAPFLGRYANPTLGEATLSLREGRLIFDVGEMRSELRPLMDDSGQVEGYVPVDPPLAGASLISLERAEDGSPRMVTMSPPDEGEPVPVAFELVEPAPATPTP